MRGRDPGVRGGDDSAGEVNGESEDLAAARMGVLLFEVLPFLASPPPSWKDTDACEREGVRRKMLVEREGVVIATS